MSDNNIVAEFNNLGVLAQKLEDTGRYDVGMLISGLKHLLTENNFFYGPLVDQAPVNDPSRVFFDLKVNPAVHQLVYVHLGGGYAKEMRGPHWCYVVKNNGQKLTVIPLTSIKEDSGPAKEPFELDIDEGNGKKGRMHFDDMRSIDKMRVIEKKGYRSVCTPRADIEAAFKKYSVIEEDDTDERMTAINELLAQKQKELVSMAQAKKDYSSLADEVDELREQRQSVLVEKARIEGRKKRINEMETFLSSQSVELTEYDEKMVRLYIERITIYDDKFTVTFKAGIDIDIQR